MIHNSREKSDRKPGGQPGHEGHRRRQLEADESVDIPIPSACPICGGKLIACGAEKRCLVELEISAHTTEYVGFECACSACTHTIPPAFPDGVVNEINYGDSIRATLSYLVNTCNVSMDKAITFLYDASGHTLLVSKGSVHNFLQGFSAKAAEEIDAMKARLVTSDVMGSDATYTSASGSRTYAIVFNSGNDALYQAAHTKGLASLVSSPVDGHAGTIVHDHDRSYYNFGTRHAECNVHILRYLKGVCENEPDKTWAPSMRTLLCEANNIAKAARAAASETDSKAKLEQDVIDTIEARYDAIIASGEAEYALDAPVPPRYAPAGIALLARLKSFRDNHLLFVRDLSVPFDNNASERLLRGIKNKTKQSGGFRSLEHGQTYYCDYLSISQSAALRGMEVLATIRNVFDGQKGLLAEHDATAQAP